MTRSWVEHVRQFTSARIQARSLPDCQDEGVLTPYVSRRPIKRHRASPAFSDIHGDQISIQFRQSVDELVEGDRIVAHTHAGGIVNRVCNGGGRPTDAEFADALRLHRR